MKSAEVIRLAYGRNKILSISGGVQNASLLSLHPVQLDMNSMSSFAHFSPKSPTKLICDHNGYHCTSFYGYSEPVCLSLDIHRVDCSWKIVICFPLEKKLKVYYLELKTDRVMPNESLIFKKEQEKKAT